MADHAGADAAADYRQDARRLRKEARKIYGRQRLALEQNRPVFAERLREDAEAVEHMAIVAENAAINETLDPQPEDLP